MTARATLGACDSVSVHKDKASPAADLSPPLMF